MTAISETLSWQRTCQCPPNHLNCLSAKDWVREMMMAVWDFSYEGRDVRDDNLHPATFPIALPSKCIRLLTHPGELVVDPFVGSGSTLVAAFDLNRNAVGFDLKEEYVNLSNSRLSQLKLDSFMGFDNGTKQIAIREDARSAPRYFEPETVSLIVTSPPYANLLNRERTNKGYNSERNRMKNLGVNQQYSQDARDLGLLEPYHFAIQLARIFKGMMPALKPNAHIIINLSNFLQVNRRREVPLPTLVTSAMLVSGFMLSHTIVWDRRRLINDTGIFGYPSNWCVYGNSYEHLLVFTKPL